MWVTLSLALRVPHALRLNLSLERTAFGVRSL